MALHVLHTICVCVLETRVVVDVRVCVGDVTVGVFGLLGFAEPAWTSAFGCGRRVVSALETKIGFRLVSPVAKHGRIGLSETPLRGVISAGSGYSSLLEGTARE